jgi:thioredoxin 1
MATIEITEANLATCLERPGITLLDIWAEWCGPCRRFGPIFERVSTKHPELTFGKVDADAQPKIAAMFRVSSIPTLMAIRDGVLLYSQPGALPEAALESLITQIQALDMDAIRRGSAGGEETPL